MTTTKALDGLRPLRKTGGGTNSTGFNEYPVSTGYSSNIFSGDLVKIVGGYCQVITSTEDFANGVFVGCRYVANGKPEWSKYWPASTSVTEAFAFVIDDQYATFAIQADASVTIGDMNSQNFSVTLGAGSAVTGRSGFGLKAAGRGVAKGMFRPIRAVPVPGNNVNVAAENAYLVVETRILQHRDHIIDVIASTGVITSVVI